MRRVILLLGAALLSSSPLLSQASTATVSFASTNLASITDKTTSTPFSGITVSDTESVDFDPVQITYPTGRGVLSLSSGGYSLILSNGSYWMSKNNMSAADAQSGLRAISYDPTENRIPMGTVETNTFTITVTDVSNSTDSAAVNLPVTPANDTPSNSLPSSVTGINDTGTNYPFASMNISDVDSNDTVTVEVRFRSVQGVLSTNASFVRTTSGGTAIYTLNSQSPSSAQTFMRSVVFTPTENRILIGYPESTIFTAKVTDAASASATDTVSVQVTAVNDEPLFSGTIRAVVNDNVVTNLFPGFVITDVDNSGTQSVVVSASVGGGGYEYGGGDFSNSSGSPPAVTFTNTPAGASSTLQGLAFIPYSNIMEVGNSATVVVSLAVSDVGGGSVSPLDSPSNTSYSVRVISVNDPPVVTPTLLANILDSENSKPITGLTVHDPDTLDDDHLTVSVTFTNPADSAIGAFSPTNVYSGSASSIQTAMQNLLFVPVRNSISTNRMLAFRFTAWDTHGGTNSTVAALQISGQNDKPIITLNTSGDIRMTDDPNDSPIYPFAPVVITDPDGGQTLTVVLSMSDTNMGTFTETSKVGTPEEVTTWLQGIGFSALRRPNRVVGQTVSVSLRIDVTDSQGESQSNDNMTILITSVNGAPRILGMPSVQPALVSPVAPVRPFSGLSVVDDDTNAITVRVVFDDPAKGVLTNLGGFVATVPGTYQIVTNQAAATAALSNLAFVVSGSYAFPVNAPGGTVFTIQALDTVLNMATKLLSIILQYEPRNVLVTRTADDLLPGSLRYAVTHCENNGYITFALPEYPATIQLNSARGPIELVHNVNFRGPGADRLTISGDSNGDGNPDGQLFRVFAAVTMEGVTLTKGLSPDTGGACYVGHGGALSMRYCAVTASVASQWGGGIDVEEGSLSLEGCLIRDNATTQSSGRGGGGISLWTDQTCSFVNTTFSGNRQQSGSGVAGGALYAENNSESQETEVHVRHCTFAENADETGQGSAIAALGFGTVIHLANSVLMDGSGRNLGVMAAGEIWSEGGNLADDSTRTTLIQEGVPEEVILLNMASDLTDVDGATVLEFPLATGLRPTAGYRPLVGSPAISHAVSPVASVDQRGVLRGASPDSGAVEYDRMARIVLNEIQFDPAAGQPAWLEFYVPRDSSPVDFGGLQLRVNGVTNHVFSSPLICQPGHGIIVADTNGTLVLSPTNNPIPVIHPSVAALDLKSAGTIELVQPSQSWMSALSETYLGVFADPAAPTQTLSIVHNSITLAPQFSGSAYVPHSLVLPPPQGGVDIGRSTGVNLSSPGSDTSPMMFGSRNAMPQAQSDLVVVGEDDLTILPVLANDSDADGLDRLVLIDLSPAPMTPANRAVTNSLQGAEVSLDPSGIADPSAVPLLRGTAVIYDPRLTAGIQALPVGAKVTDSFSYAMVDIGTGSISSYESNGVSTAVLSAGHRLTNGEQIVISGCDVTNYNGIWGVTPLGDDSFTIPVAYAGGAATPGSWMTRNQRQESAVSQGTVVLEVLGANDPPIPVMDTVPANEDTVLRIMGDATLAGATGQVFETDAAYSMTPVISGVSLLTNDGDPDSDDNAATLNLVGVLGRVHAITNYEGSAGLQPLVVRSPGHGLADGTVVLVSGYGGHPSYNGSHAITVVDDDSFTIPVRYVDNAAEKGCWGLLTDTGRLSAVSALGVPVRLDLRAQRSETSVIYDPTDSDVLNALAVGETGTDTFYCVVSDRHAGMSIGQVQMLVAGRNDAPVAQPDPGGLESIAGWTGGDNLPNLLPQLTVDYALAAASGEPHHADARVSSGTNGGASATSLMNLWVTDEDTPLVITSAGLLANDSDVDTSDVLVVQQLSPASHEGAILTLGSNAVSMIYDPTPSTNLNALARNEYRIDSFTMAISDQQGGTATSLVAVLVVGRDDSPLAYDDTAVVLENHTLVIGPGGGVLTNDIERDINGIAQDNRLVLVDRTNTPSQLPDVWSMITTNTLIYDPSTSPFLEGLAAGQTIGDEIPYVMMDGSFVFANPDWFSVRAGASNVVLEVLANDRNYTGSGGSLHITAVGTPSQGGSCSNAPGGTNLVYTPATGFVGDEILTYMIDDGHGNSDRAQVVIRVTVNRLNGVLQANNDSFAVARGETVSLDVLQNDDVLPESGTNLVLVGLVSAPSVGGQAVVEGGTVTYTPDSGYAGVYPYAEAFTYAVSAGGSSMATASVSVLVVNRQGTLEVRDDAFSVNAGSLGASLDILLNDDIMPGLPVVLTVRQAGPAVRGQVIIDGDERGVTYVPPPDFIGMDTFSYVATDGLGGTGTGVVTVSVGILTPCDDAFVVTNFASSTELDVLANDTILQATFGANLMISAVAPTNSSVVGPVGIKTGGKRLLLGPALQLGEQSVVYTVSDGAGRTGEATARLIVMTNGIEACADVFTVLPDSSGNVLDVLRNDITLPSQGKTLTVVSVGTGVDAPNHGGTVTVSGDGLSLVYVPVAGFMGEETFTYTMTDSTRSDTAKVVVKVTRGELMANPDRFTVFWEQPPAGQDPRSFVLPVTVNDIILPDLGHALSIVSLGNGSNAPDHQGTVTINGDNQTLAYVPHATNPPPEYTERFTYEISDGAERRAQGVVTVRVLYRTNAVDAATCDDVFAVERDSTNNLLVVLANDGINPATTAGWSITGVSSSGVGGVVSLSGSILRYTPPAGFVGVDHFTYEVADGFGGTGSAGVTVKVGGLSVNRDFFTVISGSQDNIMDVLVNDPIKPGTTANHHLVDASGATAGGTVGVDAGLAVYSPLAGYTGPWPYSEEFQYRVADDSGNLTTGTVTVVVYREGADRSNAVLRITVVGVNDPPVISGTVAGQRYFMQGVKPFPGVTISDVDNFGAELQTVTVTLQNPDHGSLSSLGSFTVVSNGVIRLVGVTPVQAGIALRQLVFLPSMSPAGAGSGRVTRFSIDVWDGTVSVTDTNTTLIDSPPVEAMVLPSTATSNRLFGSAVAATSNMVIAGTANDLSNGASFVSASFLTGPAGGSAAWSLIGKVMSTDAQTNGLSGVSVALEGDVLVVGAPMALNGTIRAGSAYVYYRNQGGSNHWGLVKRLTSSDAALDDQYGNAVAISGDTLIVAAARDNWNSSQNGAVYIYGRNQGGADQWGFVKKITLTEGTTADLFGNSVAVRGDTLVIGAPYRDDMGTDAGAVYIHMKDAGGTNQWGQVMKKFAPDAAISNAFGFAVSMVGDLLAVGAPGASLAGTNSGAVYLFSQNIGGTNQWGQLKKITPADAVSKKEFGCAVSLDGNYLAVGARNDLVNGLRAGSAYLYARAYTGLETWGFVRKFAAASGAAGDQYGYAVSVGGGVLAVGAPRYSVPVTNCGATYIYMFKYNNPPEVAIPVPDQMAVVGSPFGLILSANAFVDPDLGDSVTLSADYSLSPSLGAWLSFNPVTRTFSGTPVTAGTNTVRVRAQDLIGASVTNAFTLVVVSNPPPVPGCTPMDEWRELFFGVSALGTGGLETSLWGNDADPDGDGVPNLAEYSFGSNPRLPDVPDPSRLTLAAMNGSSQWVNISFRRRTTDWYLTYHLEVSSDLVVWQPTTALLLGETVVPLSSDIDLVTQSLLIPGPTFSPQFYRLRVTLTP